MSIVGICPDCGVKFPLHLALTEVEAQRALQAALDMPAPLAKQVVPYLRLFSTGKKTATNSKLARVITELTALVTSGQVTRKRETFAAPLEIWQEALDETLLSVERGGVILPLSDHNYLAEIAWRKAQKKRAVPQQTVSHPSHRQAALSNGANNQPMRAAEVASLKRLIAASKGAAKEQLEAQLSALQPDDQINNEGQ